MNRVLRSGAPAVAAALLLALSAPARARAQQAPAPEPAPPDDPAPELAQAAERLAATDAQLAAWLARGWGDAKKLEAMTGWKTPAAGEARSLEADEDAIIDLLDQARNLRAFVRDRVRRLGPESALDGPRIDPTDGLISKTYNVSDLVSAAPDRPAPTMGLGPAVFEPQGRSSGGVLCFCDCDDDEWHRACIDADHLIELIESGLGDDLIDDGGSIEFSAGRLRTRMNARAHERLAELLAFLRRRIGMQIGVDLRIYELPREVHARLLELSGGQPILSDEAERALAASVRSAAGATLIAKRSLVAQDGQLVSVFGGTQRSFVTDLMSNQTGVIPVLEPSVSTVNEGLVAALRCVPTRGRRSVLVEGTVCLSAIGETEKVTLSGGELQLPDLTISRVELSTEIPAGRGMLVAGSLAVEPRATGAEAKEKDAPERDDPTISIVYVKPWLIARRRAPRPAPAPKPAPGPLPEGELGELLALHATLGEAIAALDGALGEERGFRLEIHDVRELLRITRDRPGPRLLLPDEVGFGGGGGGTLTFDDEEEPSAAIDPDQLVEMIEGDLPEDAFDEEGAFLEVRRGRLYVRLADAHLQRVARLLERLGRERPRHVQLEVSLLRMRAPREGASPQVVLDAAQLAELSASLRAEGARVLDATLLTATDGQRLHLHRGGERLYVSTLSHQAGGSESQIAKVIDPIVEVMRTGMLLDARPTVLDDESVTVDLRWVRNELLGVDTVAQGESLVQVPRVSANALQTSVTIPPGGAALLTAAEAAPLDGRSARRKIDAGELMVLVRPRVIARVDGAKDAGR